MNGPSREYIERDPVLRDCRPELEAANDSDLLDEFDTASTLSEVSGTARRAALELARSLGTSRLLGIQVPDDMDGEMPPLMAQGAAEMLKEVIIEMISTTENLPSIIADAVDNDEIIDCCADLVDCRFSSMAALQAIGDAWISAADSEDPQASDLKTHLETLQDFLDDLDEVMEDHAEHFEVLAETYYFDNWRMRWEQCTESPPPPWIVGSLEFSYPTTQRHVIRPAFDVRSDQLASRRTVDLAADIKPTRGFRQFLWRSPQTGSVAELIVPRVVLEKDEETVTLIIRRNDEPDTTVSHVSLAGLPERPLDHRAEVHFELSELEAAQNSMVLKVDGIDWPSMTIFGDE